MRKLILTMLLLMSGAAHAQWSEQADLLSAGAAAAVVIHHLCGGQDAAQQQLVHVDHRLRDTAAKMDSGAGLPQGQALGYLVESTNRKIKAMWQANEERGCHGAPNLRLLAISQGFSVP